MCHMNHNELGQIARPMLVSLAGWAQVNPGALGRFSRAQSGRYRDRSGVGEVSQSREGGWGFE